MKGGSPGTFAGLCSRSAYAQGFQQARLLFLDFLAAAHEHLAPASADNLVRSDSEEGIAANALAAFHRLQQKRIGLTPGEGEEGGDRGQQVGRDGPRDRDQRGFARQLLKTF